MFTLTKFDNLEADIENFNQNEKEKIIEIASMHDKLAKSYQYGDFIITSVRYKPTLQSSINNFYLSYAGLKPGTPLLINRFETNFYSIAQQFKNYTLTVPVEKSFNEEVREFSEDSKKLLEKVKEDNDTYLDKVKSTINDLILKNQDIMTKHNVQISDQEKTFKDLDETYKAMTTQTAEKLITKKYTQNKESESKSAFWMLIFGLSSTIISIALTVLAFLLDWFQTGDLATTYVVRMGIVLMMSPLSVYLLKQSSNHRHFSNYYSQMEAELSTVQGYTHKFGEEQKKKVELLLALKFFGNANSKISDNEKGVKYELMKLVDIVYNNGVNDTIKKDQ